MVNRSRHGGNAYNPCIQEAEEEDHKFQAGLSYIASSRPASPTEWDPASKHQKKNGQFRTSKLNGKRYHKDGNRSIRICHTWDSPNDQQGLFLEVELWQEGFLFVCFCSAGDGVQRPHAGRQALCHWDALQPKYYFQNQ